MRPENINKEQTAQMLNIYQSNTNKYSVDIAGIIYAFILTDSLCTIGKELNFVFFAWLQRLIIIIWTVNMLYLISSDNPHHALKLCLNFKYYPSE